MLEVIAEEKRKIGYSVEEISKQTSLSKSHLRNEIRAGKLKVRRFGRRVVVLHCDLETYINKLEEK